MLGCDLLDAHGARPPLYVIEWVRFGFVLPIFIKFGLYSPRVDPEYVGKARGRGESRGELAGAGREAGPGVPHPVPHPVSPIPSPRCPPAGPVPPRSALRPVHAPALVSPGVHAPGVPHLPP